jgi:NitT/TauT family transport system ATP-binding protein
LLAYAQAAVKANTSLVMLNVVQAAIMSLGLAAMAVMAGMDAAAGKIEVGAITAVTLMMMNIYAPLNILGFAYREIRQSIIDMEAMVDLWRQKPAVADAPDARPLPPADARGAELAFDGVGFRHSARSQGLMDVSFRAAPGTTVAVVGPSGAGKSTFLRLVLGQEGPTRGQLMLDGTPLTPECDPDRGVVFQRYSVFPHLTALQNVVFGLECDKSPILGKLFGKAKRDAEAQAKEMLAAVGLEHNLNVYPAQMSGGMQQRLAIAQALIKHPRVLLLDEPFGALDPGIRLDMHALVTRLWRENGLTIIMVTHDIKEAFKLGTRVLAFDKRRVDPHAPNRYGATAVYDVPVRKEKPPPAPLVDLV